MIQVTWPGGMEGSKQVDNNNNTTPFYVKKIRPGFIYLG